MFYKQQIYYKIFVVILPLLLSVLVSFSTAEDLNTIPEFQDKTDLNTLQMVQVVFRHGDRTPTLVYPNDPYKDVDKYWPSGLGQLTERGMEQHYELGSYFRNRYNGFLSPEYNAKQIHVLSSDVDRTLMSAEAHVTGLFPKLNRSRNASESEEEEDSGFNRVGVQLVPIHTLPSDSDKLLQMTASCPRKDEALEEYYATSEEYLNLVSENQDFIKFLEEQMGVKHVSNLFTFLKFHDPLICEKAHNMPLPSWVNDTVMERMNNLRGLGFAMEYGTTELKRLSGGPLVQNIVNNMLSYEDQNRNMSKLRRSLKPKLHKLFVNSAHDDTLAAVMSSMGVFDPQIPSYASAFIVELHRRPENGEYFVQLFYRNSTTEKPHALQIPGCDVDCPLSTLVTLLKPVMPDDWDKECKTKKHFQHFQLKSPPTLLKANYTSASNSEHSTMYYVTIVALVALCLLVFALSVFLMLSLTRSAEVQEYRLKNINSRESYIEIV